jgi:hypothetical protein
MTSIYHRSLLVRCYSRDMGQAASRSLLVSPTIRSEEWTSALTDDAAEGLAC